MKVLVTGGAGFIGSYLSEELLKKGHRVHVVDNLSTGSVKNIKELMRNKRFRFTVGSILNRPLMAKSIKNADIVFHLAAAVGVKYIIDNPLESLRTNIEGTDIVLDCANRYGKKKVVIASTSEIYGKNMDSKASFSETDDRLLGPTTITRWSYSCAKALDEFMSLAYSREKKLPVVIIRFFNICGPRQTGRYGMVIPRFVQQALLGHDITIYGDGKQTRSFTHVKDAVKAIVKLSESKKAEGDVFNLGNPQGITIKALALKIKKMLGSDSGVVYIPYEKAYEKGFEDMRHRRPSINKLVRTINFRPQHSIEDILADVIVYFKK